MIEFQLPSVQIGGSVRDYLPCFAWFGAPLWSNARAAVRMFIHRRPRCELPHLPPGEGCWLWNPAAVSLAVPLVTAILSSAGASWRCPLSCRGLLFGASMANHD